MDIRSGDKYPILQVVVYHARWEDLSKEASEAIREIVRKEFPHGT